ncbi:MAG: hypothetical protein M9965_00385 [Anaerolineae bacterium]|nr:hypothetical protein [Anaerolineae bacterium]
MNASDNSATLSEQARITMRRWFWLPLLLGAVLMLVWAQVTQWPPAIVAIDINQHRADTPATIPNNDDILKQTFVARRDGLQEIELLLVKYDRSDLPNSQLIIELRDDIGNLIVQEFLSTSSLTHNDRYTIRFDPQPHSADRTYTFTLRGQNNETVSVWAYAHDVYADGALMQTEPGAARDLRFITRYRLTVPGAFNLLQNTVRSDAFLLVTALFVLPLPGLLLLQGHETIAVLRARRTNTVVSPGILGSEPNFIAMLALGFALGIGVWAIIWQWMTVLDRHWWPQALWAVTIFGWVMVITGRLVVVRRGKEVVRPKMTFHWQDALLIALLTLALSVRLLAVRDLAFSAWVDSSRHALITRSMALNGNMLANYHPLLPVDSAPYHYGFHAIAATLSQMLGGDLAHLLLIFGQLLNALLVLAVYGGGVLMTRRRSAALIAAFLVALPLYFPAYYVSWGRYTQLTGMLLFSVLVGLSWRVCTQSTWRKIDWWAATVIGLLAGGLFLIHVRVFLLYLPLLIVFWGFNRARGSATMLAGGIIGVLVALPRLLVVAPSATPDRVFSPIPGYNSFPVSYITPGWERQFYALAVLALLAAVIAAGRDLYRHDAAQKTRWYKPVLALGVWVGVLFLLLAGERVGLPESWLFNLNAMVITLFLPVALVIGIGADRLWLWLRGAHWLVQLVGYAVTGALLVATLLFGVQRQITIVNEQTVLADSADKTALAWAFNNLPADSNIAVNSWLWSGQTWAGHDGGAWFLPVTGRKTTTPPIDYIYNADLRASVTAFNQAATAIDDWSTVDSAEFLRQNGITHVYIGSRGGFFNERQLLDNPALKLLYSRDGTFIFALAQR